MYINLLRIQHFRNIAESELQFHPKLNWIVGENGSGKTSLLEAIYSLGSGRSFRTSNSKQLIQHSNTQLNLYGELTEHSDKISRIGIQVTKDQRVIRVNGDNVNIASALAEKLPVQIIAPDIYKLVDDGPRYRRHFMDWGVFHVEHQFKKDWIKLTKLLKQRNAQLKTANRYQDVSHWDTDYVGLASHINASRHGYIENLKTHLSGYLSGLEGLDKVELSLLSGWPAGRDLRECLIEHFNLDSKRALTHYGPHKADLRIKIPSGMFRDIASRGQIKLLASTLKLAQLDYLDRIGHRNAVLLLDDITSEFDLLNQRRILDWALLTRSQLFVTCTDRKAADRLKIGSSCKLFHVEHGKFKELE